MEKIHKFGQLMRYSHPNFQRLHEQLNVAPTREERLRILNQTRKSALKDFPVQLDKLDKLLLNYNPFFILANFSFCYLTYLPEAGHSMNDSAAIIIGQPHVELVQALILCHYEQEFQCKPITPPEFQELSDLVGCVVCLHRIKDMPAFDGASDQEIGKLHFRSALQDHTRIVRNWGYFEQVIRVVKKLYEPLENDIEKEFGVRVGCLVDMFSTVFESIEQRLQKHSDKLKSVMRQTTVEAAIESYRTEFADNGIESQKVADWVKNDGWTFENVKVMLMHRSIHFMQNVFGFNVAELITAYPNAAAASKVEQLLSRWAFYPGELSSHNREHFLLNNPLWLKPIMWATHQVLFWPMPGLFQSFCFEIMEDFVCRNQVLKGKYLERRGRFLEDYTADLFRKKFPGATFFQGSCWNNHSAKQEGENDLLIICDSVALVIEEKAGAINLIAKRGGPSIAQEIDQLLIEPGQQGQAFASFLRENPARHTFSTRSGTPNLVDSTNIKDFICLSITLERFGPLAAQIPKLQSSGFAKQNIPVVPAMSLADLEIILEFLDNPFQLVHYLSRRSAFELKHEFVGDELDLMVFYLRTGFAQKSIPDPKSLLFLAPLSQALDRFFLNAPDNPVFGKPKRSLSKWWIQILEQLEERQAYRRYEIGCVLLDMPDDEQKVVEKRFEELCAEARTVGNFTVESIEALCWEIKSEVSNAVLVAAPVREQVISERFSLVERLARQAIAETGADRALVILVDVDVGPWPYSGMYLLDRK